MATADDVMHLLRTERNQARRERDTLAQQLRDAEQEIARLRALVREREERRCE